MEDKQRVHGTEAAELPRYETPTIKQMEERDILKTFQVTQSMAGWWTSGMC